MRSTAINNFIDNKIRIAISEKKSLAEILKILEERNETTKRSDLSIDYKNYMISFTYKRMEDLLYLKGRKRFQHLSDNKILNLIKLMDKLDGLKEIDITINRKIVDPILDPNRLLPPSTINGDWSINQETFHPPVRISERFLGDTDFER